ncbi:sensor histidine kinase [Zavarzinella formosa]|uniref:sensor histidine kinase n=1 Tax=Zavarzinella formosa TaxID=360055 RepID=UPI0002E0A8EF|nr:ATP-binding protein [Zavarzinella formosa]
MIFQRRLFIHVTLPALVISLSLGAVCVLGIRSLNRLQADRVRLLVRDVASLQSAQELQLRLRQVRIHSFVYIMDPGPARQAVLNEDHAQFDAALSRAKDAADEPEVRRLISVIEEGYRRYRADIDDPNRRPRANAPLAEYLAWSDGHPMSPLMVPAEEVIRLNRRSMSVTADQNDELTRQTRWMLVLLGILGPLAGLVGGMGVAWGLSRSFTQLRLRIQDAREQLDQEIGSVQVTADGDYRQLDRQMEIVSDRVRAIVEQVQQQRQEISRAEQLAAVGQLAAGVAHEVRNPLTGAKILIEAALLPNGHHQLTADELRMILAQIQRVERTVSGLLNFARPTKSSRRRTDLAELARQGINSLRAQARERNVRLEEELPAGPVRVFVDPDQLLSLFTNVVLNAIEATPPSGSVRVRLRALPNCMMGLTVQDDGPGIDPEMADRLFLPFATGKPAGNGLGLYVARRIAEDHGGTLAGENNPEGGALFTLTLPLSEEDHAPALGGR